MAVQLESFPHWGSEDDKILWYQRVADSFNEIAVTGVGTGGAGDVDVDPDTGRIIAMPPGAAQPIFLGYAYRYLHVRLSSSADGTNIVNPTTFTGSTIYIGTFNSTSPTLPGAEANYVYAPFNWGSSRQLSYRTTGGRNILFNTGIFVPDGNTEITTGTSLVDLEATNQGADGAQGRFEVQVYQQAASAPATPTGGSFINDVLTPPMGWTEMFPATTTPTVWQSTATVDPSVSTTSVSEISTVTTAGVTGGLVTTPAVAEEGFFDLSGVPGDDVIGAQQRSTLSFNGETGETAVVPAVPEVQEITVGGTRSNVVATPGTNEQITITLESTFGSGETSVDRRFIRTTDAPARTQNHRIYGFTDPIGSTFLTVPPGFTYTPGTGSTNDVSERINVAARYTNNTTEDIEIDGVATLTWNITDIAGRTTITPVVSSQIVDENGQFVRNAFSFSYSSQGVGSGSRNLDLNATRTVAPGHSLVVSLTESNTTSTNTFTGTFGFSFGFPATQTTSYVFDVDTADSLFTGDVSGSFSNNANADTALTELSTAVTTMFPSITASSISAGSLFDTAEGSSAFFGTGSRDQTGALGIASWDLRDAANTSTSTTVNYSTWDDWVGNFYANQFPSANISTLASNYDGTGSGQLTLTDPSDSSNTATFNVSVSSATFATQPVLSITSVASQNGTPPTDTPSWNLVLTIELPGRSITFDTNSTTNIDSSLTLTANSGTNILNSITAIDGMSTDPHSTYRVVDYSGTEVTAFTASVLTAGTSDETLVLNRIVSAINSNTETPIDFMSAYSGNTLTLTAQAGGDITGVWAVTVDHSTGTGDLSFGGATVTTEGTDETTTGTLTNWILSTPGGQFSDTFTTDSNSVSQAQQVQAVIEAQSPPYYTVQRVSNQLVLTSIDEAVGTPITANWSINGTNQTAVNPQIVTNNPGVTPFNTQDSITLNFPDSTSTTLEFMTGETTAQAGAELSNLSVQGINLQVDNGYNTTTNPLASGSVRMRYTYQVGGVRTDAGSGAVTITTGDTSGTLATTAPTVVTQGAASFTSGTLTTYNIALNAEHSVTPLTGNMPDAADAAAQATFIANLINPLPGITAAVGDRDNEVILVQSAGARTDETVVTYSTTGTNQTATSPVTLVTRQGVDGSSQLSAWTTPFEVGAEGPPGADGMDGVDAVQTQLRRTSGNLSLKDNTGSGTMKAFLIIGETTQPDFGQMGSPINSYNWFVTPSDTGVRQLVTNGNVETLSGTTANNIHRGSDANDAFPYHSITIEADGTALGVASPGRADFECRIDYN